MLSEALAEQAKDREAEQLHDTRSGWPADSGPTLADSGTSPKSEHDPALPEPIFD